MKTYNEVLFEYYSSILALADLSGDDEETKRKRESILKHLTEELTKDEAEELVKEADSVDYMTDDGILIERSMKSEKVRKKEMDTRILAYATKFIKPSNSEKLKKKAQDLKEITDALMENEEARDKEEIIEVNGNKFHYNPSLIDISKYMSELEKVGEKQKGKSYAVYEDKEGLVIY